MLGYWNNGTADGALGSREEVGDGEAKRNFKEREE
jgi:hypothetical protein